MGEFEADGHTVKWQGIYEQFQRELREGVFPTGVPLPSEGALVRRYGVSRITVVRAMDELRNA